jgi:DNA-binding MarR family transcriptional regulator
LFTNVSPQATAPFSASADEALDELAVTLVQQSSLLSRLVFARLDVELTRSEASLLARLEAGPERITALAELDGLAQPTVTLLVKRLEGNGLVGRERPLKDGRVVLVSLTAAGRRALELVRRRYRERLRACLADLPSQDVAALERGIGAMESLIERLQREDGR